MSLHELINFSKELQTLALSKTKLLTQLQENKMVNEEFQIMDSESKIYKLIGPALVAQDFEDAKINVEKRIKFLEKEMYVI